MKKTLIGLFILINISCFSQSVEDLEYELSYIYADEEWGNKKDIAFKLLKIDNLNVNAIDYLVEVYGRNNQKDSISILFDRLIKENPKNPQPYLIRARERNAYFAGLTYTQQIGYLKEAHKLDSINVEAIYTLGKLYYNLFIEEFEKNKNEANLNYYSTNAIKYFSTLCNLNEEYKEILRPPLIQLANYKTDVEFKHLYNLFIREFEKNKKETNFDNYSKNAIKYFSTLCNLNEKQKKILKLHLIKLKNYKKHIKFKQYYENYTIQHCYFPISAFMVLPDNWETNYTVNVIKFVSGSKSETLGVELALFRINWYGKHLDALDEPILNVSLPTKVFRFTWLRTFNNPIVIRLENNNNSITLYWKVSDGAGGYEPGKIIINKSKKLTIKKWYEFVANIFLIDFWNLPTVDNSFELDGSQWILEGKELGKYHVVDRWSGGEIYRVCLKLLKLTDLKIKNIY